MADTFWHKQAADTPLFPDLVWSRPEHKSSAGKLLIVGGNAHGFAAPAEAYQAALAARVGVARVLMPQAVKPIAGKLLETVDYAPSTPSGSFAKTSLAELLAHANWADGVLLAGDLGRNSETAIVIENFLSKFSGQVTVTKDAADYAVGLAEQVLQRPDTALVLTIAQLQKLYSNARLSDPITFDMGLLKLAEVLHATSQKFAACMIVKQLDQLLVAYKGQVCSMPTELDNEDFWRVKTAATASVWWLQNPGKTFEAITTSLLNHRIVL